MKKTRIITTTVTVQPSDVEFVPRLGDVPKETTAERVRRLGLARMNRYLMNPENRRKCHQTIAKCVRRKRAMKKIQKTA